jgi:hypothetical protein
MVKLLTTVSELRTLSLFDVVPLETMLAQLAIEAEQVGIGHGQASP